MMSSFFFQDNSVRQVMIKMLIAAANTVRVTCLLSRLRPRDSLQQVRKEILGSRDKTHMR